MMKTPVDKAREEADREEVRAEAQADRCGSEELGAVERTIERAASVYFETCRKLAGAISRLKKSG